eukprot:superscaffoldBa00000025_g479
MCRLRWQAPVHLQELPHLPSPHHHSTKKLQATKLLKVPEIKAHLKKMTNNAPGEDDINTIVNKQAPETYFNLLSLLFTTCLTIRHFN